MLIHFGNANVKKKMLSISQSEAVNHFLKGFNVRVLACPGAGKSRVLLETCKCCNGNAMILSYNRELCIETRTHIESMNLSNISCFTFHGLATYCVAPVHDDIALADVLDDLHAGVIFPIKKMNVDYLLIDECQDFRPSFLELLPFIFENIKQYMIVGDALQMLYDYHKEDAASLEYLNFPEKYFANEKWVTFVLDESYRLTYPMISLINKVFNCNIKSKNTEFSNPIEIFTINLYKAGGLIKTLLKEENITKCCILTPTKKNNGPLRSCINYLSQKGIKIFIHGIDGEDTRIRTNKLNVCTWHASKGTEKQCIVVFGFSNDAKLNASFVALSRSYKRLIILQDERNPHKRLMNSLRYISSKNVSLDEHTSKLSEIEHDENEDEIKYEQSCISLDSYRASGTCRWIREFIQVIIVDKSKEEYSNDDIFEEDSVCIDLSNIFRLSILLAVEYKQTRKIQRLFDIQFPQKMSRESQQLAILNGNQSRFILRQVSENSLLNEEFKLQALKLYDKSFHQITTNEWVFFSNIVNSWNNFENNLHILKLNKSYLTDFRFHQSINKIQNIIKNKTNIKFDYRISKMIDNKLVHTRVDILSDECGFLIIWENITFSTIIQASIIASLHKNSVCEVISLQTNDHQIVHLKEPDKFLMNLLE